MEYIYVPDSGFMPIYTTRGSAGSPAGEELMSPAEVSGHIKTSTKTPSMLRERLQPGTSSVLCRLGSVLSVDRNGFGRSDNEVN